MLNNFTFTWTWCSFLGFWIDRYCFFLFFHKLFKLLIKLIWLSFLNNLNVSASARVKFHQLSIKDIFCLILIFWKTIWLISSSTLTTSSSTMMRTSTLFFIYMRSSAFTIFIFKRTGMSWCKRLIFRIMSWFWDQLIRFTKRLILKFYNNLRIMMLSSWSASLLKYLRSPGSLNLSSATLNLWSLLIVCLVRSCSSLSLVVVFHYKL